MKHPSYGLLAIVFLTACGDSAAPMGDIAGTYVLTKVPIVFEQDASHTVRIVGSQLILNANSYMAVVDVEAIYASPPRGPYQNTSVSTGTYANSGRRATFTSSSEFYPSAQSGSYSLAVGSSTLTRRVNGITFVYQKQ